MKVQQATSGEGENPSGHRIWFRTCACPDLLMLIRPVCTAESGSRSKQIQQSMEWSNSSGQRYRRQRRSCLWELSLLESRSANCSKTKVRVLNQNRGARECLTCDADVKQLVQFDRITAQGRHQPISRCGRLLQYGGRAVFMAPSCRVAVPPDEPLPSQTMWRVAQLAHPTLRTTA